MNKNFLLKTVILIVGIGFIALSIFGFRYYDAALAENDELRETIQRLENQISLLETNYEETNVEFQENEFSKIEEASQTFIYAMFDIRENNFADRRADASVVVTEAFLEEYFPEGDEDLELTMEYRVHDVNIYPNQDGEQASAFVVMEGEAINLANNQGEGNRLILQVELQQEGDNWLVSSFKQLHSEPI